MWSRTLRMSIQPIGAYTVYHLGMEPASYRFDSAPCIPARSLNRVPALMGVKAGMSRAHLCVPAEGNCSNLQSDIGPTPLPYCIQHTGMISLQPPPMKDKFRFKYKKHSYRWGTGRCVVSVEILPVTTQHCRNYSYDKSWTNRSYEVKALQ